MDKGKSPTNLASTEKISSKGGVDPCEPAAVDMVYRRNPVCMSQNHGFTSSLIPNVPESMKHELTCSLLGVGEWNNYDEADGPSPWQLPLLGKLPQLNNMSGIELI
jgi:hypothetical protein